MKALSLWQPWATWIAEGYKTIETRDWPARYRGPLLICAAKRLDRVYHEEYPDDRFPLGKALAVCALVDCRPMRKGDEAAAMCECEPGRWAWVLADVRRILPFPVRGSQGLFDVPFELEDLVMAKKAEAKTVVKCERCGLIWAEAEVQDGVCPDCRAKNAAKAPKISDEAACELFELDAKRSLAGIEVGSAEARLAAARKALKAAEGAFAKRFADIRFGQTDLFSESTPEEEAPTEETDPLRQEKPV
jgi:hypothetical protein